MDESTEVRKHKDRLRIFLIIFYFSNDYHDPYHPNRKKLFEGELKIQKLDFLLRNPDYLAHELLYFAKEGSFEASEIKYVVKQIYSEQEPLFRRLDMERFFFGAWEDLDDVIGFLKSIGFIDFSSKKDTALRTVQKKYYITEQAILKVNSQMPSLPALRWYVDRCQLIKRYFGDLSGTDLKFNQYQIDEYKNTSYGDFFTNISHKVKSEFKLLYGEDL